MSKCNGNIAVIQLSVFFRSTFVYNNPFSKQHESNVIHELSDTHVFLLDNKLLLAFSNIC